MDPISDYSSMDKEPFNGFANSSIKKDDVEKKETIFIWIDILGFSKKLEDDKNYDKLADLLKEFQHKFSAETGDYNVTPISDGLIIELNPWRILWTGKDLVRCFQSIAKKQAEFLIEQKCVVRGAIAVGTRKNSEDGFISNGLARAYKMESNSISWPIIGFLDNKNDCKKIRKMFQLRNMKPLGLKKTKNDKDQYVYFIDYKKHLTNDISDIKKLIEGEIENESNPLGVKMKYKWLCHYMNLSTETKVFDIV